MAAESKLSIKFHNGCRYNILGNCLQLLEVRDILVVTRYVRMTSYLQ